MKRVTSPYARSYGEDSVDREGPRPPRSRPSVRSGPFRFKNPVATRDPVQTDHVPLMTVAAARPPMGQGAAARLVAAAVVLEMIVRAPAASR